MFNFSLLYVTCIVFWAAWGSTPRLNKYLSIYLPIYLHSPQYLTNYANLIRYRAVPPCSNRRVPKSNTIFQPGVHYSSRRTNIRHLTHPRASKIKTLTHRRVSTEHYLITASTFDDSVRLMPAAEIRRPTLLIKRSSIHRGGPAVPRTNSDRIDPPPHHIGPRNSGPAGVFFSFVSPSIVFLFSGAARGQTPAARELLDLPRRDRVRRISDNPIHSAHTYARLRRNKYL